MAVLYEPKVIQEFADRLCRRANAIIGWYSAAGVLTIFVALRVVGAFSSGAVT